MATVHSEGRDGFVLRLQNRDLFARSGIEHEGDLFAIWIEYHGPGPEPRQYAAFVRRRVHAIAVARALCEMHLPSARLAEYADRRRPTLCLTRAAA